jgi:hypothetical protein
MVAWRVEGQLCFTLLTTLCHSEYVASNDVRIRSGYIDLEREGMEGRRKEEVVAKFEAVL